MKKKIIVKNKNDRERDRYTVVLEAIESDFKAFGEKLEFVDKHFDEMATHFGKIEFRLDKIDGRFVDVDSRFDNMDKRFDKLEIILTEIRAEIADLKTKLDRKTDLERLEKLEERVKRLEVHLRHRVS